MKLIELFNHITESLLLEDRIDHIRDTFSDKLTKKASQETRNDTITNNIFDRFLEADPTTNKIYTQWIIRQYLTNNMRLQDLSHITDHLQFFDDNKNKLQTQHRGIHEFKTLEDFVGTMNDYQTQWKKYDDMMRSSKYSESYINTPEMDVVIPKNTKACEYFGNENWCTTDEDAFNDYNDEGNLYIINLKNRGRQFQYHPATGQFVDEKHRPINIYNLVKQYPEIEPFKRKMGM